MDNGSDEWVLIRSLSRDPATYTPISDFPDKKAVGSLISLGAVRADKKHGVLIPIADEDPVSALIKRVLEAGWSVATEKTKDYKTAVRKGLIVVKNQPRFDVSRGDEYVPQLRKVVADVTSDLIRGDEWESVELKPLNLKALGAPGVRCGALHPMLRVRSEFRSVFLELGFQEMATSRFVENSFYNFDALFQPQSHPARDAQDTFFMKVPATMDNFPAGYLERVRATHVDGGGLGSTGYRSEWSLDEAKANILRTHTTAVSARTLYQLAQRTFLPDMTDEERQVACDGCAGRYFSIDRVFRNETLDATHLAEFHQIEGVLVGKNVGLGELMGVIGLFFERLGMSDVTFKPAYNPYTEPSMEIFAYHAGLGKMVEVGNSGVFRPEMLVPMGFPNDICALGFGLSLERPTMIRYKYSDIRSLTGQRVDIADVHRDPIADITLSTACPSKELYL